MPALTVLGVKSAGPGRHADGNGLYLLVKPTGGKSWLLRVQVNGKRRDYGLGSANVVKLVEARERAEILRRQVRAGIDPVAERNRVKISIPTFAQAAAECHAEMRTGWKNRKHAAQWLQTLSTYAYPTLGSITVDAIEAPMIRDTLSPIWMTVPETAKRVHQRIGTVLDFAQSKGWRQRETPTRAVLKGLAKRKKVERHFAAMPFKDVPGFVTKLSSEAETVGRLALMFTVLTAARSGETRGATWSEIDFEEKLWTVPEERMKAGKEHVVPLSKQAISILHRAKLLDSGKVGAPIFPGQRGGPLSDMTLSKIMRDADLPFTVHGFRSSFRDWAAEATEVPSEVAEKALAHTIPNRVEAAYRRTNFLDKRRSLMDAWANFTSGVSR